METESLNMVHNLPLPLLASLYIMFSDVLIALSILVFLNLLLFP